VSFILKSIYVYSSIDIVQYYLDLRGLFLGAIELEGLLNAQDSVSCKLCVCYGLKIVRISDRGMNNPISASYTF